VLGILKGFDQMMNVVLENCVEYLRDPADPTILTDKTRHLGLVVCKGRCVSVSVSVYVHVSAYVSVHVSVCVFMAVVRASAAAAPYAGCSVVAMVMPTEGMHEIANPFLQADAE